MLLPAYPGGGRAARQSPRGAALRGSVRRPGPPGRTAAAAARARDLALDAPHLYDRPGNPYLGPDGRDWPDNHRRFAALGLGRRPASGSGALGGWRPDMVHAHDWQAGLAPAYLALPAARRPATVMTVHNLAFQGLFPAALVRRAGPAAGELHARRPRVLRPDRLPEGGAVYADRDHHGEPDLCAGDPDRGAGHGAGRRCCARAARPDRHPERHRRRGLGSRRRDPPIGRATTPTPATARRANKARAAERASASSRGPTRRCSAWSAG